MPIRAYTELQPKDGDTVLHCEHVAEDNANGHFFALGLSKVDGQVHGEEFIRPDGSRSVAQWIAICEACFQANKNNPAAAISGDSRWNGDEPVIKAPVN